MRWKGLRFEQLRRSLNRHVRRVKEKVKGFHTLRHTGIRMLKPMLFFLFSVILAFGQKPAETDSSVPIATQWLYDAIAPGAKGTVDSVLRIWCKKTGGVGSGFVLESGYVITNHHVVQGCAVADLEVATSVASVIPMADLWFDQNRDLAAMKPKSDIKGTFKIGPTRRVVVGTELSAWGYPFAQPGPAPFLTVGHLSGFSSYQTEKAHLPVKHLVINGAFNPGNSGGPVISPEGTIVGVVVTKWIVPLPAVLASALKALDENKSGLQFTGTTEEGKSVSYAESQLIAALLDYYRQVSQVFIGEAIAASELASFLNEKKIPWTQPRKASETSKAKPRAVALGKRP
jgi:S1-C subfamily serine protease